MYKIILYEDARGNCPFLDFLNDLEIQAQSDKKAAGLRKKINYCIDLIKFGGTRVGEKFTKQIDGKLWELRPDDHRVFFFMWNGNHIVLLHSFRKETQKTPQQEIEIALKEMKDWTSRNGY